MANTKKDLSNARKNNVDLAHAIAGSGETKPNKDKYRFSLVMPSECREYLERAAYNASEPGHLVSINQYICDLVKYDMEHGGVNDYHKNDD